MKLSFYAGAIMLMLIFSACSKDKSPDQTDDTPRTGTVEPVGTPDGSAVAQKTIGAAGGSLTSTDGLLKLNVPAGSFTADQQVSITRISNTNPIKKNSAYRILPEGTTFAKPVQLTFSYTAEDIKGSLPEGLGIAFQNKEGIWMALPVTRDKQAKTITVETSHFSDWSLFTFMELKADFTELPMDQATEVTALIDWGLFNPKNPGTPISKLIRVPDDLIKSWKLNGAGVLTTGGNPRTYRTPKYFTGKPGNPATITVELKQPNATTPSTFLLVTEITTTAGYVEFRIGSGAWNKVAASPAISTNGKWQIYANTDDEDGRDITFALDGWSGNAPGGFVWSMGNPSFVRCAITMGNEEWASFYDDPETSAKTFIPSPGMIDVTSYADGFITGTFSGSKFGIHSSEMKTTTRVEGKFHVMQTLPQ